MTTDVSEHRQNDEARRAMLATIRAHLAASAPMDAVHREHHAADESAPVSGVLAVEHAASPVERFRESLVAVGGHCAVVRDESDAIEALQVIIAGKQARRVAVSDAPLARRVVAQVGADVEVLTGADAATLFECDLGVTGVQWGVAETGTLVLESERERHRLTSLVPPVHVALVEAQQIRHTLGEVMEAMRAQGVGALSRAITFITGPSRTSDIELTLAIGVHGPAELHVIIIAGEGNG